MAQHILLCRVTNPDEVLNLGYCGIFMRDNSLSRIGEFYRAHIAKGKRLGYKVVRNRVDEDGIMCSKLKNAAGRIVEYFITTPEVAKRRMLIP